jgi:hypothetical protein
MYASKPYACSLLLLVRDVDKDAFFGAENIEVEEVIE